MRTAGSCAANPLTTAAADCACRDYIEHQHDRKAEMRGKIGSRAASARDAAGAVEQTHHAFDDENIRVVGGSRRQSVEQRGRHGPANRD